ncbi:GPW/gp25 family protein [Candidatus Sororendozoicomonas aggregata]|uniref:GPW/gp25 family protein n=1 Tax=Candidatus Sororendozoicomonas aggregata TaxID=3073239 RepID=UPI002ED13867
MNGIDATTGKTLSGKAHLRQSIADILRTPIGSRVMRRDYGSRLFDLIDAPVTPAWKSECYAAVAEALDRWEPRLKLHQVKMISVTNGQVTFDLFGEYLPDGSPVSLEGIIV